MAAPNVCRSGRKSVELIELHNEAIGDAVRVLSQEEIAACADDYQAPKFVKRKDYYSWGR